MRKLLRVLALIAGLALFAALAACSPEESGGAASSVYYTVTFDAQGGSEVESQSMLAGNPVRRPVNPVRADHYFVGWFDEAEGGEGWDFGTDRVTGDLTLYAHWSALPAEGEVPTATESLTYERYGEGYTVTGVGEESVVVIPSIYEELPVVAIRDEYENNAFANARFTEIYIPDSVTEIGRNTFYSCMELEAVYIGENSALASIGRNAFSGCSSLFEGENDL